MRKNIKSFTAATLVATLALGSSLAVLADNSNSGNMETQAGTLEGHVTKSVTNVLLPVTTAGSDVTYNASVFNYTIDPERLVQETDGAKYGDADFPKTNDTGVYFLTGQREAAYTEVTGLTAFAAGTDYYTKDADTYTKNTAGFDATKTYYTKTETYSGAIGLTEFAEGITYYTKEGETYTKVESETSFDENEEYYTKTETYSEATGLTDFVSGTEYYTKNDDHYTKVADNATFASGTTYYTYRGAGNIYSNESGELKVINKSSHAINLTVKAEAVSATTDIALTSKDNIATSQTPALYLGLKVNAENAIAITKDTAAEKTVSIAGKPNNFKTKVNNNAYEYSVLTLEEYQALAGNSSKTEIEWDSATFKLEGDVTNKTVESTTTAPKIKVTWSWVDPAAAKTVTFDSNGGSTVQSQSVTSGAKATEPTAPTKEGFTFVGWYSDEDLETEFDFDTAITADTTLYAKWEKSYDVTADNLAVTWSGLENNLIFTVDLDSFDATAIADIGIAYKGNQFECNGTWNNNKTLSTGGFVEISSDSITINTTAAEYLFDGNASGTVYVKLTTSNGDITKEVVVSK